MKRQSILGVKMFAAAMLFLAPVVSKALAVDVLMQHNDPSNDGQNLNETVLTPDTVKNGFGKQFAVPLDGGVRGQPLVKTRLKVTTGPHRGVQDVVFVVTNNDSIYAINADDGTILWGPISLLTKFHDPDDTVIADTASRDVQGIHQPMEDTPAIDPTTNVLYVECSESEQGTGTGGKLHWIHLLSATNLADGTPFASPVNIAEGDPVYVSGPSIKRLDGSKRPFDSGELTCRCLTLNRVNHIVYMAYGDPGDFGPYNGWIVGYTAAKDASNNLTLAAVWCSTPNGNEGGIWQGGGGITVDPKGNLFINIGNGTFETSLANARYSDRLGIGVTGLQVPDKGDYGDSVVKLAPDSDTSKQPDNPNGFGLHVIDYFTPGNEQTLSDEDADLGSNCPVLLSDVVGSAHHKQLLAFTCKGKGGIFLVDQNNMGGYNGDAAGKGAGPNPDRLVQKVVCDGSWLTFAFYAGSSWDTGTIYTVPGGGEARAFSISNAQINPTPTSTSKQSYGWYTYDGSIPQISANGGRDAILWTIDADKSRLVAYDASDLKRLLFRSDAIPGNTLTGKLQHLSTPTIANGHVYVGTSSALNVYGVSNPH